MAEVKRKEVGGAAVFSKFADSPEIRAAEKLANSQWKGWEERDAALKLATGKSEEAASIILDAAKAKTRGIDPLNPTREQQMALSTAMGVISEAVTHTRPDHIPEPSVGGLFRWISARAMGGQDRTDFFMDEMLRAEKTQELPRTRVEKAFDIVADARQYQFLAHIIYTYSGFRHDAAVSLFGRAKPEDVALAVAFDKAAKAQEEPDGPPVERRAQRCMVAFGPGETFKAAAAELVREGMWYDLGDAARIAPYERAKEICDVAAENGFWGTLINSRHNDDRRVDPYAVKLYQKMTVADVEAAAAQPDWTVVGCAFEWCAGEVLL